MSSNNYPKPDRSDHYPQKDAHRKYYPELDLSSSEKIFNDGRPYIVEDWVDKEMEIVCMTCFYSTIGIENWDSNQHKDYLNRHNLLSNQEEKYKNSDPGIKKIMDNSGNEMWSVTSIVSEW
ncbi:MAG: hypothetical protein KA369_05845 [Spirochaetes bacterium]|nr:hypothetical protein [Spirochaetota bacterium]